MSPVGARAGVQPAQLNGKQKEVTLDVWRPNLRCPRNGTADEALDLDRGFQRLRTHH
jgi:hypothetical protein